MTKTRILIISVITLAILNVATLGFMFMNKPPHRKHNKNTSCEKTKKCESGDRKGKGKREFGGFLSEKLNFDEGQQKQFESLKNEHKEQFKQFHEEKKSVQKELFSLLKEDVVGSEQKAKLISQAVALEGKMIQSKMEHFEKLKGICKPGQVDAFMEMMERMGDKMPHGKKGHHKGGHHNKKH